MENILSTDAELTVDQVAELDAKREKLEKLQDQVHRAESIDAAREAVARPTFKFPSGQKFTANREAFGELNSRQLFFERLKAQFRGERISDRFIDFGSAATGNTNAAASLLPVDLQDEMIRLFANVSAVRNAATVRSYASDVEIPIVTSRATITATTLEGVAYDELEPDFGKVRFRSFKTAAETAITEEAIADARGGLVDEILQQHSEAHGNFWETAYTATTAAADTGAPDGLRCTEASLSSAGFSDDAGSVVITDVVSSTNTIASVTYKNLLDVAFGMPAKYWGLDKSWIMSPAMYQHVLGLTDDSGGTGRPLFQARASGTLQDSATLGSLFGYPVLVSDALTEGTVAGKFQAILLERGSYIIADRAGISSQMDEFTRGAEGMTVFRTRMRSDGRWVRPSSSARLQIKATA
jgi:HK97 family phage major capsid protein